MAVVAAAEVKILRVKINYNLSWKGSQEFCMNGHIDLDYTYIPRHINLSPCSMSETFLLANLQGLINYQSSSSLSSSDEETSITLRLARILATASPPVKETAVKKMSF